MLRSFLLAPLLLLAYIVRTALYLLLIGLGLMGTLMVYALGVTCNILKKLK